MAAKSQIRNHGNGQRDGRSEDDQSVRQDAVLLPE